jgi:hypothetical protein
VVFVLSPTSARSEICDWEVEEALSPTSARSEICDWEVEEATRLGKRILPVIQRPLEGASPPQLVRPLRFAGP